VLDLRSPEAGLGCRWGYLNRQSSGWRGGRFIEIQPRLGVVATGDNAITLDTWQWNVDFDKSRSGLGWTKY
jgi:hypothetical protein